MRWRRSPSEMAYRLRQEIRNLRLLSNPPLLLLTELPGAPLHGLPELDEFTDWELAAELRAHRFPLLGLTVKTGPVVAWRRDYVHGKETRTGYFRTVPFLDFERAGDHKIIWELNRHQHLVVLARACRAGGDGPFLNEISSELRSWFAANPFQRGINWASALEVGFRALSWIWVYHLVGDRFPDGFRRDFLQRLYWHGCHLEANLSFYYSPNTHLLGEAVALHALGMLFPQFPKAAAWRKLGRRVMLEQMEAQVRADGVHIEQSTYYHLYALDMFRFHAQLEPPPESYNARLRLMEEFLQAVMGPARRLPLLGDDDGGRFFHPYGSREEFGRASVLEGCAAASSKLFPDSGIAVMSSGPAHIVIDAGPFGPWTSGHSHSDTLSLIAQLDGEDVLIDPGTYTYVGDPKQRDWFRGSAAHNTIRVDGRDQAIMDGPFAWTDPPKVTIVSWSSTEEEDALDAQCEYGGFTHRRRFRFIKGLLLLLIEDEVSGPEGEHEIEQFWHLGAEQARARLILSKPAEPVESWASSVFGEKHRNPALVVRRRGPLPVRLSAAILLGQPAGDQLASTRKS